MPTLEQRKQAYRNRVQYAHQALLRKEDSRKFDNCFEMHDGAFVVVALMRRAETDPELRAAICAEFGRPWPQVPWHKTVEANRHLSNASLAAAAAHTQIEEEWKTANIFLPQLSAINDDDNQRFEIIRREGPVELVESFYAPSLRAVTKAVQSWTDRTVMGQPFLSMLAQVSVRTPDGELISV